MEGELQFHSWLILLASPSPLFSSHKNLLLNYCYSSSLDLPSCIVLARSSKNHPVSKCRQISVICLLALRLGLVLYSPFYCWAESMKTTMLSPFGWLCSCWDMPIRGTGGILVVWKKREYMFSASGSCSSSRKRFQVTKGSSVISDSSVIGDSNISRDSSRSVMLPVASTTVTQTVVVEMTVRIPSIQQPGQVYGLR